MYNKEWKVIRIFLPMLVLGIKRLSENSQSFIAFWFVFQNTIWFNIGSVESFERSLENTQLENNIEPTNFVPLVYKSEAEV